MNLLTQCQQSIISCVCYSILVGIAIIIIFIASFAIHRLLKAQTSIYEIIPMKFCILQSILHVIEYAFSENNKIQILTLYFQILVFTSISVLFADLCYKVKSTALFLKSFTSFKILQGIIYGIFFILQIVFFVFAANDFCDKYYYYSMILMLIEFLISTFETNYFGYILQQKLERVSKYIQIKTMNPKAVYDSYAKMSVATSRTTFIQPKEISEKKQQIKVLRYLINITLLFYALLVIIVNVEFNDVTCNHNEEKQKNQDFIILFYGIIQMIPCLVIPYVFGYIPQLDYQNIDLSDSLIILDKSQDRSVESIQI